MNRQEQQPRRVSFAAVLAMPYGRDLAEYEGQPDDIYAVLAVAVYGDEHDKTAKRVVIHDDGPCGCDTLKLWR